MASLLRKLIKISILLTICNPTINAIRYQKIPWLKSITLSKQNYNPISMMCLLLDIIKWNYGKKLRMLIYCRVETS